MREDYLRRLKNGTQVVEDLTRVGKPGSYQQLKTIFGLAIATILYVFDERGMDLQTFLRSEDVPAGLPVTKDIMKDYLYAVAGYVGDSGEAKTLSRMDTVERSRFFENIRRHAASAWSIQIPDPNPLRDMKE